MSLIDDLSDERDHLNPTKTPSSASSAERRWLLETRNLTNSLLTAASSVDPHVVIADHARRAALAAEVVTIVGMDVTESVSSKYPSDHPTVRRVHNELLSRTRSIVPSAVSQLPPELLESTRLPAGPVLLASLSVENCDLGVLAFVRKPGDPTFGLEEVFLAAGFARRAAAVVAHVQAEESREARAVHTDRVRIAANLHDLVIQSLFGVGLRLQSLSTRIDSEEVAGDVDACVGQIDDTILAVRRSIFALRQPVVDQIGLRSRILNIVTAMPFGFEATVHFSGPIDSAVPDSLHDPLLISLGEILTNVMRHARASAVDVAVSVELRSRVAELVVTDDGVGWKGRLREGHGTGNILERASALGGSCTVTTSRSGGTEVRWWVSLSEPAVSALGE